MLLKKKPNQLVFAGTIRINYKENLLVQFSKLLLDFVNVRDKNLFNSVMLDFIINEAIILFKEAKKLCYLRKKQKGFKKQYEKKIDIDASSRDTQA